MTCVKSFMPRSTENCAASSEVKHGNESHSYALVSSLSCVRGALLAGVFHGVSIFRPNSVNNYFEHPHKTLHRLPYGPCSDKILDPIRSARTYQNQSESLQHSCSGGLCKGYPMDNLPEPTRTPPQSLS
jgi:hypothetical protein